MQVRPTSDRLRETLFNVIAPRIGNTRFLDICSGSGAVGIEALSRGAAHVTFVDRSRKMCGLIEANLDLCRVPEDETEVLQTEAAEFLRRVIAGRRIAGGRRAIVEAQWDLVFFDPPYATDYLGVLELFGSNAQALLSADGLLVVEHHHKNELPDRLGSIHLQRILKQGDSALSFYEAEPRTKSSARSQA